MLVVFKQGCGVVKNDTAPAPELSFLTAWLRLLFVFTH